MSTAIKIILGVIVSVVLVVIIVVVIAAYWFSTHKDQLTQQFVEGPKKAMQEGRDYGRTTDNDGCVNQAFEREKKDSSMTGAISNNLFLKECLDNSKNTPNFCASVPEQTSFLKSADWMKQQCKKRGAANDQYCSQLLQQVQQFCYK